MINTNPFITAKNLPQSILWQDLINGKSYNLELITPSMAQTKYFHKLRNKDVYVEICAEVIEDQTIEGSTILKGQLIKVGFPIKATENAISRMNYLIVQQITENTNLKIEMVKKSRKLLTFHNAEIKQPSDNQIEFSEKIYNEKKIERKKEVIVRNEEML